MAFLRRYHVMSMRAYVEQIRTSRLWVILVDLSALISGNLISSRECPTGGKWLAKKL